VGRRKKQVVHNQETRIRGKYLLTLPSTPQIKNESGSCVDLVTTTYPLLTPLLIFTNSASSKVPVVGMRGEREGGGKRRRRRREAQEKGGGMSEEGQKEGREE
jgi:hypothetical protein